VGPRHLRPRQRQRFDELYGFAESRAYIANGQPLYRRPGALYYAGWLAVVNAAKKSRARCGRGRVDEPGAIFERFRSSCATIWLRGPMKNIRLLFCFTFVWCLHTFVSAQEFVDGVDLTTTKAPWTMRMLGNDLDITNVQAKPDEASAYFMMASGSTKLNVSVFIEPVDKCRTAEACRDHVLNLGNPAWGKFEQLGKGKIKDFSYFEFYRPEVNGEPMKMFDMYAQYV
jgi:hypothetical protein